MAQNVSCTSRKAVWVYGQDDKDARRSERKQNKAQIAENDTSNPALWQTTLKNNLRRESSNDVDGIYSTGPAAKPISVGI